MGKLALERGAYKRRIENVDRWVSPSNRTLTVEVTRAGKVYRVMFFNGDLISVATRNGAHVETDTKLWRELFEAARERMSA